MNTRFCSKYLYYEIIFTVLLRNRSRSQWAVDKAKENIRKHYAFVGVLEDLEDSLQLMEILMPRYFQNAKVVYQNPVRLNKVAISIMICWLQTDFCNLLDDIVSCRSIFILASLFTRKVFEVKKICSKLSRRSNPLKICYNFVCNFSVILLTHL